MVVFSDTGMEAAGMQITTEHILIGIFSFFSIAVGTAVHLLTLSNRFLSHNWGLKKYQLNVFT